MTLSSDKVRLHYLDVLRVIAIIMVLYNHRATYGWPLAYDQFNLSFIASSLLSLLCKCGPPLFFMVSGALILSRNESFSSTFSHRILRIVAIMALLGAWDIKGNPTPERYIEYLFQKENWYLYAYLAFLLMSPFIRAMVSAMDDRLVRLWFAFVAGAGVYAALCRFFFHASVFPIAHVFLHARPWASSAWHIIFPISGYLIAHRLDEQDMLRRWIIIGGAASIALSLTLTSANILLDLGAETEMLRQHLIFLPACAIFLLAKEHITADALPRWLTWVSGATFGMYLIEVYTRLSSRLEHALQGALAGTASIFWIAMLSIAIEFVAYALIAGFAKKLPGLRKLL